MQIKTSDKDISLGYGRGIMSKEVSKKLAKQEMNRTVLAVAGTFLYACGINFFISPIKLNAGGIMGYCQLIRTILTDYAGLDFGKIDFSGIIYFIVNIPIFVLAYKRIGRRFFAKTLLCVTTLSFFSSVLPIPAVPVLDDKLACCLIGGIMNGIGTGMTLSMGASSGGMDVVGLMLIQWRHDLSVGKVSLAVNAVLYALCLLMFSVPMVIYSLIFAAAASVAVDRTHAQNINAEVTIITRKDCGELEHEVFYELGRGITKWQSQGAYTDEQSEILYILCSKYEVNRLKQIIKSYDKEAFIIVKEGVSVDGNFLKKL